MPKSEGFSGIESGDLFQAAERLDASLNLDLAVRRAITEALRHGNKSREQVAGDISRLVGQRVTVTMINDFTAETKATHRFPAAWLAAFCVVTRDLRILQIIAEHAGCRLITADEAMLIELAKSYLARKKAADKIESLESRLSRRGE